MSGSGRFTRSGSGVLAAPLAGRSARLDSDWPVGAGVGMAGPGRARAAVDGRGEGRAPLDPVMLDRVSASR